LVYSRLLFLLQSGEILPKTINAGLKVKHFGIVIELSNWSMNIIISSKIKFMKNIVICASLCHNMLNPTKGQKLLMLLITKMIWLHVSPLVWSGATIGALHERGCWSWSKIFKDGSCGYMWGIVDLVIDFWNT